MSNRVVYLMRGLPSCGKSHRARELAGGRGLVFETDEFFLTQVGDDPNSYDYDSDRLEEARQWNFDRFEKAVQAGFSPLVVDRGNGLNRETQRYAQLAVAQSYTVLLAEPDTPWWYELSVLLKHKEHTMPVLERWSQRLAKRNRQTHRTPAHTILRWMKAWDSKLTVQQILEFDPD